MGGKRLGVALATIAGLCVTACSGGAPSGTPVSDQPSAPPPELDGADVPPPPQDPIPDTFDLPGGQGTGTAPSADPGPPPPAKTDRTFWAIDGEMHLVKFAESDPSKVTKSTITGLATGEHLVGIAFRAKDTKLYAVSSASRLLVLDTASAKATAVGPKFVVPLVGQAFGFAFDPSADEARVHSDLAEDLRVDPQTGWLSGNDPGLVFRNDDRFAAESPSVVANAYSKPPIAGGKGTLYAIDADHDILGVLPVPLAGEVVTVGDLGVDVEGPAGFDITQTGEAFAALRVDGTTSLYAIDLGTGKAKAMAAIGVGSAIAGLAVQP
jgi:hypothetical protein